MAEVIELPARLDLNGCRRLHADIREQLGSPLIFDASRVTFIGGIGLQILMAAANRWRSDKVEIEYDAVSRGMVEGLERLGARMEDIGGLES